MLFWKRRGHPRPTAPHRPPEPVAPPPPHPSPAASRLDRFGARWMPSCLCGEASSALTQPVHLPVDRLTAAVCRHRMPLSRTGSPDQ